MKNLIKLFLVALLGILTFTSCKTEREPVVDKEKQEEKERKEFIENIESYPLDEIELVKRGGLLPGKYAFASFEKGDKIRYELNQKLYEGFLEENVTFLGGGWNFKMKNGARLISFYENPPRYSSFELIQISEEKEWSFEELNHYAINYPMTIVEVCPFWQNLVIDYEQFVDLGVPETKFKVKGNIYVLFIEHYFIIFNENREKISPR